jgi:hypothetical protein
MATTVHIPAPLLAAADRRARVLKISRNRLIIRALEQELASAAPGWSPGFFEALASVDRDDARALDRSMRTVRARRSSKKAPRL